MTAARWLVAFLLALVPAAGIGAGNFLLVELLVGPSLRTNAPILAFLAGAPLVLGLLLVVTLPRLGRVRAATTAAAGGDDPALRLLGALQEEGRLVDFLQEDITTYPDDQVGAVAREIHEGCRKVLRERVALEPVLGGAEGATVTVEEGFDTAAIRLTGNVTGAPPFAGVLRHGGWRATETTIPERAGQDPRVIAPAEVELP